jgi:hypothetical protein
VVRPKGIYQLIDAIEQIPVKLVGVVAFDGDHDIVGVDMVDQNVARRPEDPIGLYKKLRTRSASFLTPGFVVRAFVQASNIAAQRHEDHKVPQKPYCW